MTPELNKELLQRYPRIFENPDLQGIRCGDGWFDLIDTLCQQLQQWAEQHGAPQPVASQVKEKFGRLRFSTVRELSPEQQAMVETAEAQSCKTCEQCGKPGTLMILKQRHRYAACPAHTREGSEVLTHFV